MPKLNIGCGKSPLDGYENIDRKTGQEAYPLAYPDDYADEIRASHILEHFSHREVPAVLQEWVRVLKPGGEIKIAVPHFEAIIALMLEGHKINAQGYIMGGHVDDDDRHGALFTAASICELLKDAGLERTEHWDPEHSDTADTPISLNVKARKPLVKAGTLQFDGVYCVLPTPRYGPSAHHRCIYDALGNLNMSMHTVSGCFWNQHLCEAIEAEIAKPDCRYILTLDFDSLFSTQDVIELYRIMETHPHIDALVPMQSHRGAATPLFSIAGKTQVPPSMFDGLTTEISTGHFGLTMIRADKLRDLPRPWMVGTPNEEGRFGPGHTDPDIDFWYKWTAAGNTAHLACKVVIGHIEDMALWPSKTDLAPVYQRVTDYLLHGKPKDAR